MKNNKQKALKKLQNVHNDENISVNLRQFFGNVKVIVGGILVWTHISHRVYLSLFELI